MNARNSLLLILVLGCHHAARPGTVPTGATATLAGHVQAVGDACAKPGPGCSGPLAEYEVVVLAKDGTTVVAKTRTDSTGAYSVTLPAGDYTIVTPAGMTEKKRNDISVAGGASATLDLAVDSGARSSAMPPPAS